jgi:hypothetical protein
VTLHMCSQYTLISYMEARLINVHINTYMMSYTHMYIDIDIHTHIQTHGCLSEATMGRQESKRE